MSEDVGTTASPEFISKFRKKRGLDKALKGVFKLGQQEEELVDDSTIVQSSSPLNDHPDMKDVIGGEEPNPMMGTNTSLTTNLQEQTGGGESLNKRYVDHADEMRRMEAQERRKIKSPSERQVNLSEESIRLGSKFGIPNKTDMEQIRKDPEFVAAQESMKPKSTGEKVNGFLSNFPPQSIIRYGQMGSKASGIELNPSPNGDPTIGFAISDPKSKKTTKYTYPVPKDIFKEIGQDPDDPATPEESLGRRKFNYLLGLAGRGESGIGERTKKEDFDTFVDISKLGGYLP